MDYLKKYQDRFNNIIDDYLPDDSKHKGNLYKAIHYSFKAEAKRLRPALIYGCAETFGVDIKNVDRAAFAIECIHTYSLIHDDLPAMDDDDLRRGLPTCHIQFDEATAILAGDALNTLAFQVLADGKKKYSLEQISILALYSGVDGMIGGQDLDLFLENNTAKMEDLQNLHKKKTASLIQASLLLGYQSTDNKCITTLSILDEIGEILGLYYQIQDDIFDVIKTTQEMGKTSKSDLANNKMTYVSLLGLEQAKLECINIEKIIYKKLSYLNALDKPLHSIINSIIERQY